MGHHDTTEFRSFTGRTVRAVKVLTVYAHPNPTSFCHAVLEQFTRGLEDAGHTSEVVDLYAIKFNPVFGRDDYSFFAHESVPRELFDEAELRESMVRSSGGPIKRGSPSGGCATRISPSCCRSSRSRSRRTCSPSRRRSRGADGLAFVAPIFWMNLPAILRGWVERVFTYGFVYTMTEDGWRARRSQRPDAAA